MLEVTPYLSPLSTTSPVSVSRLQHRSPWPRPPASTRSRIVQSFKNLYLISGVIQESPVTKEDSHLLHPLTWLLTRLNTVQNTFVFKIKTRKERKNVLEREEMMLLMRIMMKVTVMKNHAKISYRHHIQINTIFQYMPRDFLCWIRVYHRPRSQ